MMSCEDVAVSSRTTRTTVGRPRMRSANGQPGHDNDDIEAARACSFPSTYLGGLSSSAKANSRNESPLPLLFSSTAQPLSTSPLPLRSTLSYGVVPMVPRLPPDTSFLAMKHHKDDGELGTAPRLWALFWKWYLLARQLSSLHCLYLNPRGDRTFFLFWVWHRPWVKPKILHGLVFSLSNTSLHDPLSENLLSSIVYVILL